MQHAGSWAVRSFLSDDEHLHERIMLKGRRRAQSSFHANLEAEWYQGDEESEEEHRERIAHIPSGRRASLPLRGFSTGEDSDAEDSISMAERGLGWNAPTRHRTTRCACASTCFAPTPALRTKPFFFCFF